MHTSQNHSTLLAFGFVLLVATSLMWRNSHAQVAGRIEIHAIPSITVTTQQFLTANLYGKPVMIGGELRIPQGTTGKIPAVILAHGSSGLSASNDQWAREFNAMGIAVFLMDSVTGRGIFSTSTDQSQLDSLSIIIDAYAALARLSSHPRINASQIAIMGNSKGAVAAVYSSVERFKRMYAAPNTEFAAHIGLSTPCITEYRDDDKVTKSPLRLHHGTIDDYTPLEACREYTRRLQSKGADVILSEYAGAHHSYENFTYTGVITNPKSQTLRNCMLREDKNGAIINAETGQLFNISSDSCVEFGPSIGYDKQAHEQTLQSVKDFLIDRFKLKK